MERTAKSIREFGEDYVAPVSTVLAFVPSAMVLAGSPQEDGDPTDMEPVDL